MTEREKQMTEDIKNSVTVPMYFESIILPNMQYYYGDDSIDLEIYPVCKCPLHNEDTGSFRYFDYSNSFYCYGCTIGGDVITLHIEYQKATQNETIQFVDAIKFLYAFFIEGNQNAVATKRKNITDKQRISTNVELVRFNKTLVFLEKYLLETTGLNIMQKSQAFHRMDLFESFVNKNKINAMEARETLITLEKSLRSLDKTARIKYVSKKEKEND